MSPRYDWLDDEKTAIIDRYTNGGEPMNRIAADYDVTPNTIRNRLQEWNVEIESTRHRYGWLDDRIEEIIERYVKREESLQTIADELGTSTSPIKTRLREAGVELRPVNYSFSDEQRSVVMGELLGDGCIYRRHETACHFRLESTVEAHPAYVRERLPDGVFPASQPYSVERSTKWGDSTRWTIYSRGQQLFDELHEDWYEENGDKRRKIVPDGFTLDEIAIYHWYIGDGSLSSRPSGTYRMHFSTHGFPEASVRRLQAELDSMGYENYSVRNPDVENGSGLAIYVSAASSRRLLGRIAERNRIADYEYKFSCPEG